MVSELSSHTALILSWLISAPLLFYTIKTINWAAFSHHAGVQHFFLGSLLVVSGFWFMRAGVRPGLDFHIIAATALTLLMGWRLALLNMAIVLVVMVFLGVIEPEAWAVSFLLGAAIPVFAAYQFFLNVYRRMPHNPFIYILVAGFLNAGFTQVVYACSVSGWYWFEGIYTLEQIWRDYLRMLPLMMFPEGITNGMFIAGMVSFHPRWLSTFDEDSYFNY